MTKEQLAKFGITIEKDSVTDEEAEQLIADKFGNLEAEKTKLKGQVDKYSGEISAYKKKEAERMSEEEKEKLRIEGIEAENKTLHRQIEKTNKVNEYLSIGYDRELATQIADAELDGKSTSAFHKKHIEAQLERQKAELLKQGGNKASIEDDEKTLYTKENFNKGLISMEKMNELKVSNPTLYNELLGK